MTIKELKEYAKTEGYSLLTHDYYGSSKIWVLKLKETEVKYTVTKSQYGGAWVLKVLHLNPVDYNRKGKYISSTAIKNIDGMGKVREEMHRSMKYQIGEDKSE